MKKKKYWDDISLDDGGGVRIDPFKHFINTVCKLIVHSCWTEFNSKAHFHGKYLAGGPMLMPF